MTTATINQVLPSATIGRWNSTDADEKALVQEILTAPNSIGPRDVYADWLEERGYVESAAAIRQLTDAAKGVKAAIGKNAWTVEESLKDDSYNAKVARKLFAQKPELLVVVVSNVAPTHQGLEYVAAGPVVYYRKSSGGRWGRSVQQRFVCLKKSA